MPEEYSLKWENKSSSNGKKLSERSQYIANNLVVLKVKTQLRDKGNSEELLKDVYFTAR